MLLRPIILRVAGYAVTTLDIILPLARLSSVLAQFSQPDHKLFFLDISHKMTTFQASRRLTLYNRLAPRVVGVL